MKHLLTSIVITFLALCTACDKQPTSASSAPETKEQEVVQSDKPVSIRWDWSNTSALVYDYTQSVKGKSMLDDERPPMEVTVEGEVKFEPNESEDTASMTLTIFRPGQPRSTENAISVTAPKIDEKGNVIPDEKDDEVQAAKTQQLSSILDYLFPIPEESLPLDGSPVDVPVTFPLFMFSEKGSLDGTIRLKHKGIKEINGLETHEIDVVLDLEKINGPEAIQAMKGTMIKGGGVLHYAPQKSAYVKGEISYDLVIKAGMSQAQHQTFSFELKPSP